MTDYVADPSPAPGGPRPVVALGEAMVRLSPPDHQRLETATSLEVHVGGAELNVLVALSRLGHRTVWVTRLPDNPLGRLLAGHAGRHGVEVRAARAPGTRAGLYFVEHGAAPRPTEVLYDRAGSAAAGLTVDDHGWAEITTDAAAAHVSGITCALGPGPHAASRALLSAAREAATPTSFDVNHRTRLWSDDEAVAALRDVLPLVDILFTSPQDLQLLHGHDGDPVAQAAALRERFGAQVVVVRSRREPHPGRIVVEVTAVAEQVVTATPVEAQVVDAFGAGDVAAAAFLDGWLTRRPLEQTVELAARAYAHMTTIPGDTWLGSRTELDPAYGAGRSVLR